MECCHAAPTCVKLSAAPRGEPYPCDYLAQTGSIPVSVPCPPSATLRRRENCGQGEMLSNAWGASGTCMLLLILLKPDRRLRPIPLLPVLFHQISGNDHQGGRCWIFRHLCPSARRVTLRWVVVRGAEMNGGQRVCGCPYLVSKT